MSFESGGIANKLGNYYEGRWVVNQLLSLLNEKINSVTVEAIGDDEKGVDLWIESKQGIRQAHQCKARNASKEYWNINDLASRKILNHLQCQLTRDPNYEFVFVSSVGSELFNDICSYARRSGNNPNAFYQKKILKSGDKTRECFSKFCAHLSLNPDCDTDRAKAFDYLKRTYITVYSDDLGTWQSLLDLADYLLIGDPETIVSTLLAYAENNDRLGAVIYADELRQYLSKKEIHPKRLDHDSRITNVIPELKRQFDESIAPYLINGSSIDRTETSLLIEAITNGKNVILSGPAGHGKSGVLFELTEYLDKNNIPFLPIRLDRRDPENNASHFGKQIGRASCRERVFVCV